MKFVLTEEQAKRLFDKVDKKVTCKECGWEWSLSEGGDDPYVCHECGHDNAEDKFIGKRVMVYYNLHKHTFSVTYKSKVILHADYVKLGDVEFRVRKGGKEKVRTEMAKNVHAFVIGKLLDYCQYPCENIPQEPNTNIVTYNPYKYDSFVYKDSEQPVYKAKEVDMVNLRNKLFVISEVRKIGITEQVSERPNSFTYTTIGKYEKFNTRRYYFNNPLPVPSSDTPNGLVSIKGGNGNFIFNEDEVNYDPIKNKLSVDISKFDKKYPNSTKSKEPSKVGINSTNIKKALELAFPENWHQEDQIYTPGLRDVYTIGEKLGDDESWSVLNYFDTKDEIHSLIYLKYIEENTDKDIVEWMADLFKNNKEYTKLLVDRQWMSIANGLKLERDSVNNFLKNIDTTDITYYPHGSKMDRWGGVDVTINGVNYQIKPLKSYNTEEGITIVDTYGMRDYSNKPKVDKIAFANPTKVIEFDNKDYDVISKSRAIFKQEPKITK
jgi:hypothetical protein